MHFADRLFEAARRVGNTIVVGIDPKFDRLPEQLRRNSSASPHSASQAIEEFCRGLVDVVAERVPAVKFQAAYFEALGPAGCVALDRSTRYASERGLIVILDGKRNDIGPTAEAYATAYLGPGHETWSSDALTINPYLGSDGITPFLDAASRSKKGAFCLVRTSNPSAREFQDLESGGRPLYEHVAEKVAAWASTDVGHCGYGLLGAVVGATYPRELVRLREVMPQVILLIPGYGTQGGKAADITAAFDDRGFGAVVNNSRGIIYAHERQEYRERFAGRWQDAVAQAVTDMRDDLAANTTMGRLS